MADTRISPTCEHAEEWDRENKTVARFCGRPTRYWYPAMGGGTAALCEQHGAHLRPHVRDYPEGAMSDAPRPARDGETLSDEPTDAQVIDRLESALLAAKAADTEQDADEWYHLADTYSEQLADRLAALRAQLADARAVIAEVQAELDDVDTPDAGTTCDNIQALLDSRAARAASGEDASHE